MVESRPSMFIGRYEKRESVGDGIHILGERDFDQSEEEEKDVAELHLLQELTQSINEVQGQIAERVHEQEDGFVHVDDKVEQAAIESHEAGETIKEASKTQFRTFKWKIGSAIGAVGAAVGAFFGGLLGAGAGGTGGTVVGAGIGKGLERQGEKKLDKIEFQKPGDAEVLEKEKNYSR